MVRTGVLLAALIAVSAVAQTDDSKGGEMGMPPAPKPTEAHAWLKKFEGEWEAVGRPASPTPGMSEFRGGGVGTMFGDFWVEIRQHADMGGVKFKAIQTIGYDPEKKKYFGTWIDTNSSHMWFYEGDLDASGKKLSLVAEGPSFIDPTQTAKYRDSYEFVSDDHYIARAEIQDPAGQWILMMTSEVTRPGPKLAPEPTSTPKSQPASQPK